MELNSITINTKTYGDIKYSVEKDSNKYWIMVNGEDAGYDGYESERAAFAAIFDLLALSYT